MEKKFKVGGYFTFQEKLLRISGLSLNENESLLYRMYSWAVCLLVIVFLGLVIHDISVYFNDVRIVTISVPHSLALIVSLCKYRTFTVNRTRLNKTLDLLQNGVFMPNKQRGGDLEEIWIAQCIKTSNRLMMTGWVLSLITLFVRVGDTLLKRITNHDPKQWQLPFAKFVSINPTRSPNFELAWLYQSVVWTMTSCLYVVPDFFVIGVFAHVGTQFKMLRNSINRIIPDGLDKTKKETSENSADTTYHQEQRQFRITWDYIRHKLKEIVRYHRAIIDIAQRLEDIINVFVLINYVGAIIALACLMYHGSLYPLTDSSFQRDVTACILVLFQLLLISYFANEVAVESQLVLNACFEDKFFGIDIRFQRSLSIIMCRSQKPTKFTIGKFSDLTVIGFASLVRSSFSYFMVLHNINQKK